VIKANDGVDIYLDNNFEANGRPGVSWSYSIFWFFLAVNIMAPIQMHVVSNLGDLDFYEVGVGWWSFGLMIIICVACVIFMWVSLFRIRQPMAYHWGQIMFLSFRIFYMGALLWLSLTNIGLWAYVVVICLWLFSELTNKHEVNVVGDEEIREAFRKRFKPHPDGYLLYNPIANVNYLHKKERAAWVKWRDRLESLGAAVVALMGPVIFIRSQLYRENFEPRFLIVAGLLLAMALALRGMTTEVAIARRALKLKQQEG
jgi:Ca2+/Na+ antiporter